MVRAIVTYPPEGGLNWKLEDVTPVEPKEYELCVRIIASGICHSDIVIAHTPAERGNYPIVLGHEGKLEWKKRSNEFSH